jgi:hypothetical protein
VRLAPSHTPLPLRSRRRCSRLHPLARTRLHSSHPGPIRTNWRECSIPALAAPTIAGSVSPRPSALPYSLPPRIATEAQASLPRKEGGPPAGALLAGNLLRLLPWREPQTVVPQDTRVKLPCELAAPGGRRLRLCQPSTAKSSTDHFHVAVVASPLCATSGKKRGSSQPLPGPMGSRSPNNEAMPPHAQCRR